MAVARASSRSPPCCFRAVAHLAGQLERAADHGQGFFLVGDDRREHFALGAAAVVLELREDVDLEQTGGLVLSAAVLAVELPAAGLGDGDLPLGGQLLGQRGDDPRVRSWCSGPDRSAA